MNDILKNRSGFVKILNALYPIEEDLYLSVIKYLKSFGVQILRNPSGKHNIGISYKGAGKR